MFFSVILTCICAVLTGKSRRMDTKVILLGMVLGCMLVAGHDVALDDISRGTYAQFSQCGVPFPAYRGATKAETYELSGCLEECECWDVEANGNA